MAKLTISEENVRIEDKSGFVCLTDMAKLKDPDTSRIIGRWMRATSTIQFFQSWEVFHCKGSNHPDFEAFKLRSGENTFSLSVSDLVDAGATGIYAKRGRYGGTYAHIDWAIHFANWLDPDFYVMTVAAFRQMNDAIMGRQHLEQRFARELVAETYPLATGAALSALPPAADALFEKRIASVEADILNLALWGMTAQEWRIKFPQTDARKNMRDYATPEELKTLSSLQILSQEMHENGYSSEERLDRLRAKAQELIQRFCAKHAKQDLLLLAQHKRGWGRFTF
jgi:hypothetical protein